MRVGNRVGDTDTPTSRRYPNKGGSLHSYMITLKEFGSTEMPLTPEAYAALRSRYTREIGVEITEKVGVYRVTARDYVGRVGLPGGGILVIQPKVGIANLFYMLCAEAGLARFRPPPTGLEENPDIFAFVLAALLHSVEELLRAGLYRDYRLREERLPFVRGRVMLAEQLRHGALLHQQSCRYADLTADTLENRMVAAALRQLPVLLRGPGEEREMVRRARALLLRFEGIGQISRSEAIALLPGINIHRLNAVYGPLIGLCKLALHHLTLDERLGPHPFASFLVDMPRLFESFLTVRLRALLPAYGLRVVAQRHDYLDEGRTVGIRPDVLVYAKSGHRPLLVLDAKYRRSDDPEGGLNRDLYQVSAYLDRYGLSRGVLVYPQFDEPAGKRLKLRGTPKHLHIEMLNLAAPTPAELEEGCSVLAAQVARLSHV
jgi:5-methylcytosine-specific restriction enzyme subunit McrC